MQAGGANQDTNKRPQRQPQLVTHEYQAQDQSPQNTPHTHT